ncbi:MAG: phosphatase PAP2 family protein [Marinilabiliales bacterium]|nr:phosphatase PAP2 family protein [Marinilabiliales bacterium]
MLKLLFFCLVIMLWKEFAVEGANHGGNKPLKFVDCQTGELDSVVNHPQTVKRKAIVPLVLVASGAIVESCSPNTLLSKQHFQRLEQDAFPNFHTSLDNYMQYVPLASVFVLKLSNVRSRSDLLNQTLIAAKSELLMTVLVTTLKNVYHDTRPDGAANNTMPSGHTAQAFVSATILDMEYRDTSPWISASGYACAVATGFMRIANNRHWISDVLIGAGIGISSVRLVYGLHQYRWGSKSQALMVPFLDKRGGGLAFAMKF